MGGQIPPESSSSKVNNKSFITIQDWFFFACSWLYTCSQHHLHCSSRFCSSCRTLQILQKDGTGDQSFQMCEQQMQFQVCRYKVCMPTSLIRQWYLRPQAEFDQERNWGSGLHYSVKIPMNNRNFILGINRELTENKIILCIIWNHPIKWSLKILMEENICGLDDGASPWVLNASRKVKLCSCCSFDFLHHLVAPLAVDGPQLWHAQPLCALRVLLRGGTWHGPHKKSSSPFSDPFLRDPCHLMVLKARMGSLHHNYSGSPDGTG